MKDFYNKNLNHWKKKLKTTLKYGMTSHAHGLKELINIVKMSTAPKQSITQMWSLQSSKDYPHITRKNTKIHMQAQKT